MSFRRNVAPFFLVFFGCVALIDSHAFAGWQIERLVAPGVLHVFTRRDGTPCEANVVRFPLADAKLILSPVLADSIIPGNAPVSKIADEARQTDSTVVAAINGDYFKMNSENGAGDPLGFLVLERELVSFPYQSRSAFVLTRDGKVSIQRLKYEASVSSPSKQPHILNGLNCTLGVNQLVLYTTKYGVSTGTTPNSVEVVLMPNEEKLLPNCDITCYVAEVSTNGNVPIAPHTFVLSGSGISADFLKTLKPADEVTLSIHTTPALSGIVDAIGGGPRILRDGKISVEGEDESFTSSFVNTRHPRTAIGISPKSIVFVTVDGRQNQSRGMSLSELAQFMRGLGCTDALNLDGGGSTTMIVKGSVVNSPSDGRERHVADALVLTSRVPAGTVTSLSCIPSQSGILADGRVPLILTGRDSYGDTVTVHTNDVKWTVAPAIGQVSSSGMFTVSSTPDSSTKVTVTAQLGMITAQTTLTVYPFPTVLSVSPSKVSLSPGQEQQFVVIGRDANGNEVPSALLQAIWTASPTIGSINSAGVFRAVDAPGIGTINASVGTLTAQCDIKVEAN